MDTTNIFEEERNDIIQSLKKKKTYKILFKLKFIRTNSFFKKPYETIDIDYLQSNIQIFCKENNIKLKKIVLYNCFSKKQSYIKICGNKKDQILLHAFLFVFDKYLNINTI